MKVILVGHDFGGACISYIMELFPLKISKAVFIAATMLTNGQSTLDVVSKQVFYLPPVLKMLYFNFHLSVIWTLISSIIINTKVEKKRGGKVMETGSLGS